MHILLIHQAFASTEDHGGTRHFELARRCIRSGHRFTVVSSDLSYMTGKRATSRRRRTVEGITILKTSPIATLHRSFILRVVSFVSFMMSSLRIALAIGKTDVIMGTSPPIFQAVSAWVVAAVRRRPFLLEIRDIWPLFAIDMKVLTNPVLIRLSQWLELFLYSKAVHILVNSPAYVEYLKGKGVRSSKVDLIANGVDMSMFDLPGDGEKLRQELSLKDGFVVTYTGALGLANDIPTLLKAAARLREDARFHFLLVGDGKERHNLEKMTRRLGLRNVTFLGPCPKSRIPSILRASDACVAILRDIPSFRTTYPNKVFDYMASERPVILAIDGVIRDMMDRAKGGICVSPGDDCAIAEAILFLSDHREEAQRMGRAGHDYVARHFNREDQAEAFVSLIERLYSSQR